MAAIPTPTAAAYITPAFFTPAGTTVPVPCAGLAGDAVFGWAVFDEGVSIANANGFTIIDELEADGLHFVFFARILTDADSAAGVRNMTTSGAMTFGNGLAYTLTNVSPDEDFSTAVAVLAATADGGTAFHVSGITTTEDNATVFLMMANGVTGPYTPPSGFTEDSDPGDGTCLCERTYASAGATGNLSFSVADATAPFVVTLALKPNTIGLRLYLDSAASAPIAPSDFASVWDSTASALTRALVDTPGSSTMTSTGVAEAVSTNNYDVAIYRGVYGPIGAGTIDGFFRGVARFQESNSAANDLVQVTVRILQPDGSVRAVCYAGTSETSSSPASEFATTLTNRIIPRPGDARGLTSQAATNGDYLEVTIGYRANNTSTTSRTGTLRHGDAAGTDCAVDETSTIDNRPWIQLDAGLPVYVPLSGNGALLLLGIGT